MDNGGTLLGCRRQNANTEMISASADGSFHSVIYCLVFLTHQFNVFSAECKKNKGENNLISPKH